MYLPGFDTFKIALHGNPAWIDDVEDPQAARPLLNQLASVIPGEDLAYEQRAFRSSHSLRGGGGGIQSWIGARKLHQLCRCVDLV
jgi:hypothetical protein